MGPIVILNSSYLVVEEVEACPKEDALSIKAPVSITENEGKETIITLVVIPNLDPQLLGTKDHLYEICPSTDTNSSESSVGRYVLQNKFTRDQPTKRYKPIVQVKSKY